MQEQEELYSEIKLKPERLWVGLIQRRPFGGQGSEVDKKLTNPKYEFPNLNTKDPWFIFLFSLRACQQMRIQECLTVLPRERYRRQQVISPPPVQSVLSWGIEADLVLKTPHAGAVPQYWGSPEFQIRATKSGQPRGARDTEPVLAGREQLAGLRSTLQYIQRRSQGHVRCREGDYWDRTFLFIAI